jgi:hypothetical protein
MNGSSTKTKICLKSSAEKVLAVGKYLSAVGKYLSAVGK